MLCRLSLAQRGTVTSAVILIGGWHNGKREAEARNAGEPEGAVESLEPPQEPKMPRSDS